MVAERACSHHEGQGPCSAPLQTYIGVIVIVQTLVLTTDMRSRNEKVLREEFVVIIEVVLGIMRKFTKTKI